VSPSDFIPIAESNGLIEPIGLHVLERALEQLASWQSKYGDDLSMAVNLSPSQFKSESMYADIKQVIEASGVQSSSVELEITEGVLISSNGGINQTLNNLTNFGVKLALDDFGTGYSSLSYLRQYTFDTLKIDREFINELTGDNAKAGLQLVAVTIAMAHSLGMTVVAEGVETQEQCTILTEQGCCLGQGLFFSAPVLPEQISMLMEEQTAATIGKAS
jgi:EAL domain-containing protein (putative c-di-GMP-specific phosphodiesterase class I)